MKGLPNFDRLAKRYRRLERLTFGSSLWNCRCAFLDELRTCRTALVFGDGDGRFTARLLEENPLVLIDAVDASVEMLRELVRNAGARSGRVRIHLADARLWEPTSPACDLIVTHFFLDCLTTEEVAALATRLRSYANPDALWVVSEFAIPEGRYGRWVARPLVTGLYFAFWLLTGLRVWSLPKYRESLTEAGFKLLKEQHFLSGLLVSELWAPKDRQGPRTRMQYPPVSG